MGDVLNDDSLRNLQDKITDLKRQEAQALTIYTPKNEKVRLIQSQLQPLETEFELERSSIIARIGNDYDAAVRREQLLSSDYKVQSAVVTDQAGKSIQYNVVGARSRFQPPAV